MKVLLSAVLLSSFFLTACELVGPSIRVDTPKVKVPGVIITGQQKHCPPGQAKKGNC